VAVRCVAYAASGFLWPLVVSGIFQGV